MESERICSFCSKEVVEPAKRKGHVKIAHTDCTTNRKIRYYKVSWKEWRWDNNPAFMEYEYRTVREARKRLKSLDVLPLLYYDIKMEIVTRNY